MALTDVERAQAERIIKNASQQYDSHIAESKQVLLDRLWNVLQQILDMHGIHDEIYWDVLNVIRVAKGHEPLDVRVMMRNSK